MASRGRITIQPGDVVAPIDSNLRERLIVHSVLRNGRYILQHLGTNKLYFATRAALRKVSKGKLQAFIPGRHKRCSRCGNDYVMMTAAQDGECLSCMLGREDEKFGPLRIVTGRRYDARAETYAFEVDAYGDRDEKIPIYVL